MTFKAKASLLGGLMLSSLFSFSQDKGIGLTWEFPKVLPAEYEVEPKEVYDDFFKRLPELKHHDATKEYMQGMAYQRKYLLQSAQVLKNAEIEQYLNDIIKELVSDSIIKKYGLHVYASTNASINAGAYDDGTIMFNVFNFNYLNAEDEVAAILAHEIGHVVSAHGTNVAKFYDMWGKSNPHAAINLRRSRLEKISQGQEFAADHISSDLLINSDYNSNATLRVRGLFKEVASRRKELQPKIKALYNILNTHPTSKEREDSMEVWFSDNGSTNQFVVSEDKFFRIKYDAMVFALEHMLSSSEYLDCFQFAVEQYVTKKDKRVVYYILESSRRIMALNAKKESVVALSERYRVGQSYSIYWKHKQLFLGESDSVQIAEMREKKIITYAQFFDYFSTIAKEEELNECYLSIGLREFTNEGKTDYLNKAVEKDPHLVAYVGYVLGKKQDYIGFRDAIVMDEVIFDYDMSKGYLLRNDLSNDSLITLIESRVGELTKKYTGHEVIKLSEVKATDFNLFIYLSNLHEFLDHAEYAGKKLKTSKDLNLIFPELWMYCQENKIKRFDFLYLFRLQHATEGRVFMSSSSLTTGMMYSIDHFSVDHKEDFGYLNHEVGGRVKIKNTFRALDDAFRVIMKRL